MFGNVVFGLIIIYCCYYIGMIGFDLYKIDKSERLGDATETIDISGVASDYKPVNVRSLFDEETNETADNGLPDTSVLSGSEDDTTDNVGGREEHLTPTYQEGYTAKRMKEIFVENSSKPSLFANVKFMN